MPNMKLYLYTAVENNSWSLSNKLKAKSDWEEQMETPHLICWECTFENILKSYLYILKWNVMTITYKNLASKPEG